MIHSRCVVVRAFLGLALGFGLVAVAPPAAAFPGGLDAWIARYGAISPSGENADCQLCHAGAGGGQPWNAYGWDWLNALDDLACDFDSSGDVSRDEAFFCIETLDSDADTGGTDNITEITLGTQPGWRLGASNTTYGAGGGTGVSPPGNIGSIDPDGTEPPPPPPPPPPGDDGPSGPLRWLQLVWPGQSLQRAVDRARSGGLIFVLPGEYREIADPVNGLNITKSVHLIGLSTWKKPVVLKNAGNQRNGIAAVPPENTDCMGCHEDMAPPFPLQEGVEPGFKETDPVIYGLTIRGITIEGFRNNGLFAERVDGFNFSHVRSVDNRGYGIFPILSKNGVIKRSYATGSHDSGIWVETSQNVKVLKNVAEGNVNGFELSNSDDVVFAGNVARYNTVGFALLLLPEIYDERPGAKRIVVKNNWIHDNNKENTSPSGTVLAEVPKGIGVLLLGLDDSVVKNNLIENNEFSGVAIADYCLTVLLTPFACYADPGPPGFVEDAIPSNNEVVGNTFVNNASDVDPGNPFAFAAGEISMITLADEGNCFSDNIFDPTNFFSTIGILPECP